MHPSVLQWSLSLRIQADGRGVCCLMPGGQYGREYRQSEMEGAKRAKVHSRGHGTTAQSATTCDNTAVTLPWPTNQRVNSWKTHVDFFSQIFGFACSGSRREIICFPTPVLSSSLHLNLSIQGWDWKKGQRKQKNTLWWIKHVGVATAYFDCLFYLLVT